MSILSICNIAFITRFDFSGSLSVINLFKTVGTTPPETKLVFKAAAAWLLSAFGGRSHASGAFVYLIIEQLKPKSTVVEGLVCERGCSGDVVLVLTQVNPRFSA